MLLLSLAIFFIQPLSGQDAAAGKSYFIVQVTDPQFGMNDGGDKLAYEATRLEKAVTEINRLKPDFAVFTGDLVNDRENKSQWAEFRRITATISEKIPVLYIPGNHDIGSPASVESINEFKRMFGDDRFSHKHKKSLFIGINSCLIKSGPEDLEQEQRKWLEAELKKGRKAKNIVIFSHYPFFIKEPAEPENYSNLPATKRMNYIGLFSSSGVRTIFAGHLHNNSTGRDGNIDMVTTSAVGKPLGSAPSGLRVIIIGSSGIRSEYYGLDGIPEIIKFVP